jgi:hypothetical protein
LRWPVAIVLVGGCDLALGLDDPIDAPPPPCAIVEHDEDGDGDDDSCDPCPQLALTTKDGDGDGIGDACDPQPAIADRRVLFTGFDVGTEGPLRVVGNVGNGRFRGGDDSFVLYEPALPRVELEAAFHVVSLDQSFYREIGLFVHATPTQDIPDGTYCAYGEHPDGTGYGSINDKQGTFGGALADSEPDYDWLDLSGTLRVRSIAATMDCELAWTGSSDTLSSQSREYVTGGVGVHTFGGTFDVGYLSIIELGE